MDDVQTELLHQWNGTRFGLANLIAQSNPGGHKGLGEGGAIGAPPAVINAVADALLPLGVVVHDQPLTPAAIVDLIDAT